MTIAIRRQVLAACAGALMAPQVGADEKTRRLAILTVLPPAESKPYLDALYDGLRERGWIEGRNLIVDLRYTNGQPSQVSAATAELLALKPDVFHAALDYVAKAAAESANPPPIIFAVGNDPVGLGLVKSLARPGTKVTGLSAQNYELVPKRLSLLKEALPTLVKVGVMEYGRSSPGADNLTRLSQAAATLGLELLHSRVDSADALEPEFKRWASQGVRGFMNVPNIWFAQGDRLQQVAAPALKYRIATCYSITPAADAGLLMSYSVDFIDLYRRSAKLVDQVLKGGNPAEIPVEQANVYELVLNQRTAQAIGIVFPRTLLFRATRVVD